MRAGLLLVVATAAPTALAAQVRGRVVDDGATPVAEAFVELYAAGVRVAGVLTAADGRFAFLQPAEPPLVLIARRIGFEPSRTVVDSTARLNVTIRLRRRPVTLAAVTVSAEAAQCVARDDPEARSLWTAMRGRYAPWPETERLAPLRVPHIHGEGASTRTLVRPESVGVVDTAAAQYSVSGMTLGRRHLPTRAADYYGRPHYLGGDRYDRHAYPFLDGMEAWHFADTLFGAWNRFGPVSRLEEGFAIAFCSRPERVRERDREPYITGLLTLASDTTLLRARWRFMTNDEEAGGEALFVPAVGPGAPPLSAVGLFWRRRVLDVVHVWTRFRQWYWCDSTCVGEARRPIGRLNAR